MVYLTLPAIHGLLVKLLSDVEVDLRGTHRSGGLDVELLSVLADLYVRLGGCRPGHLPQHGVHAWQSTARGGSQQAPLPRKLTPPWPWPSESTYTKKNCSTSITIPPRSCWEQQNKTFNAETTRWSKNVMLPSFLGKPFSSSLLCCPQAAETI